MRIALNIILSFVILIQSIGFSVNSVTQLDDLWMHYQEHKTEHGDNLLTFLDLHYGSQQHEHEHEHPEHQDLPSQPSFQFQYTYLVDIKTFDLMVINPLENVQHNFGYSATFNSLLETDILQPPKALA